MQKLSTVDLIALVLVIVVGLNWGLVGLADFNLVTTIFGTISRIVYVLVGLAAIYLAAIAMKLEKK